MMFYVISSSFDGMQPRVEARYGYFTKQARAQQVVDDLNAKEYEAAKRKAQWRAEGSMQRAKEYNALIDAGLRSGIRIPTNSVVNEAEIAGIRREYPLYEVTQFPHYEETQRNW